MYYLHGSGFIMRSFIIYLFILSFCFEGFSQSKEGAYWYWGQRAGLNFNKNPVVSDTLGQTFTSQWATISDSLGRLLFYTNGYKIYNQNHQLVFDTVPAGAFSGAMICRKPGSLIQYYVIYRDPNNGFSGSGYFFEYDVTLNNGLGGRKTFPILFEDTLSGGTMTLLQHSDNKRFWLMGLKNFTPEIRTYLVDSNGVSSVPVISTAILAPPFVTSNALQFVDIKSSPNSNFVFLSYLDNVGQRPEHLICFQFNKQTGQAFNRFYTKTILSEAFGWGSFSPNSNILYYSNQSNATQISTPGELLQVDISSLNQTTIQSSEVLLKSFNQIGQYHLGSQIGLDGKLYLTYTTFPSIFAPYYLARINCPNVPGLGCGYQDTAVNLEDRRPGVFFPVLNQTLFVNANILQVKSNKMRTCQGDSVELSAFGAGADNFTWSPATGLSDPLSANPKAAPSVTTTYTATGISNCGTSSTASITIQVVPRPVFTASISPTCIGDSSTLSFTGAYPIVRWSPGATLADSTLAFTKGRFLQNTPVFVRALDTSGLCTAVDTLLAVVNPLPTAQSLAGPDTTKCSTAPISLGTATVPSLSYQWGLVPTGLPTGLQNPNTAQPLFTFVPPGTATNPQTFTYRLQVTDSNGCKNADTVLVFVRPLSKRLAGADLSFCSGDSAQTGTANLTGVAYSWRVEPINPFPGIASLSDTSLARPFFRASHNDSTSRSFRLIVRGIDIPIGIGSQCINQDTAIATVNPLPTADSIVTFTTCSGVPLTLSEPIRPNYLYLWRNADGNPFSGLNPFTTTFFNSDTIARTDTLLLTLTDTLTGCTKTVIRLVRINPLPRPNAGPDSLICSGDTINIGSPPRAGLSYQWSPSTGIQSPSNSQTAFTATNSANRNQIQTRTVLATDSLTGCQNRDTVRITVSGVPRATVTGPTSVCPGLEGAFYTLNGLNPFTTISQGWQVQGGSIESSSINSLTVNWDSIPTDSARVILIPTNARGCKGDTASLIVRINKELATETPNGDTVICSGTGNRTYSIQNTTGSNYFWQAAGTSILSGQGSNSITLRIPDTLTQTTTFSVWVNESTITRTDTCLGNSDTLRITVNPSPVRRSILPENLTTPFLCANDTIAVNLNGLAISPNSVYNWQVLSTQANLIAGQGNDTVSIRLNASTTGFTLPIRVRETSDKGCLGPQIDTVLQISPQPFAQAGADSTICSGDSLQIGTPAQTGTNYLWSLATNLSNASSPQPVFSSNNFGSAPQSFNYQLNTQNQQGCRNRDSITILLNPEPAPGAQIAGPAGWCSTDTVIYNLSPTGIGSTLNWSINPVGTLQVNPIAQTIQLFNTNPQDSGTFQIKVLETNSFGCSGDTVSRTISLFPQPRPQLSEDSIACEGNLLFGVEVTNPNLGSTFNWNAQQGQISSGQGTANVQISFNRPFGNNQTRILTLTETSQQSCLSDTISKIIYLDGSNAEIIRATTLPQNENQVEVLYEINNAGLTNQLNREYELERSINSNPFVLIFSSSSASNRFTEATPIAYPEEAIQYRLTYLDACNTPRTSSVHNLIQLSGRVTEAPFDQSQNGYQVGTTQLDWNTYEGWSSEQTEVYRTLSEALPQPPLDSYRTRVNAPWEAQNGSDAFIQTYRIKAKTEENSDTIRYSWSNSLRLSYQNPLKFFNLVTPNGDGLNETFIISNVQLYDHRLTILDRWGRTVLQTNNYNNDWSTKVGGTYFYRLENRTTGEEYSGWVQVVE